MGKSSVNFLNLILSQTVYFKVEDSTEYASCKKAIFIGFLQQKIKNNALLLCASNKIRTIMVSF
jgi:hypothetical protein